MNRFFDDIIQPILERENISSVVEIGARTGDNTQKLIKYVKRAGGILYSIDPVPDFPCDQWEEENDGHFIMYKDLSLNVLPDIHDAGVYLIDGDHNWYTVYNELTLISKSYSAENFPLIMFHDVCWPYDRRDLYYDPETIPSEYRHPYAMKAIRPDSDELVNVGINDKLYNAVCVNNPRNGIRTAIDDFLKENPGLDLEFYSIDILHGLGMLASRKRHLKAIDYFNAPETLHKAIKIGENDRIRQMLKNADLRNKLRQIKNIQFISKLYPDYGEGFSEETAVKFGKYDKESESFYGEVCFDKVPKRIRFDPVQDSYCAVDSLSAASEKGALESEKHNGFFINGKYVFDNSDPQIIFNNSADAKKFRIRANIFAYNSISGNELYNSFENKIKEDEDELEKLKKQLDALENDRLNEQRKNAELTDKLRTAEEALKDEKEKSWELRKKLSGRISELNISVTREEIKNTLLSDMIKNDSENIKALSSGYAEYEKSIKEWKTRADYFSGEAKKHLKSYRFRIGALMVDSLRSPAAMLKLPFRLIKILREYKKAGPAKKSAPEPPAPKKAVPVKALFSDARKADEALSDAALNAEFNKFLNYSFLSFKILPQRSVKEKSLGLYMDKTARALAKNYSKYDQDILVSIIMPTYNRKDIIGTAIDSVIDQSYKNWELIIIDDNSTDDTEALVRSRAENDKRIRYLKNTNKKGVCGARNTGLAAASGKYIAYLDSDNDWQSDYLLLMVNSLKERNEHQAVYCAQNVYKCDPDTKAPEFQYIRFGAYNHSIMKNKNYIDMNCYMHTAELYRKLGGFNENLSRLVDWELIHRYASESYPYSLPCRLSNYYFEKADVQITSKSASDLQRSLAAFYNEIKGDDLNLNSAKMLDLSGYELYSDKINPYKAGGRKISVIIPSYEALPCLAACIEAIRKFTADVDYEIIIVDNNSSGPVKEYLTRLSEESDVKIILNEHNMGFTYAVNQGIKIADADSDIVLMNNDAIVTEGWIGELYRVKDTVSKAGLIVPRQVLLPNTKTMQTHVPEAAVTRELDVNVSVHHQNVKDINKYRRAGFIELSFAPFFLVMITRRCISKLGLLDEENGRHYRSDRLYCQKAIENGIEVVYTPYSKAYHLLQQSTAELKEKDAEMYKTIFVKNDWSDIGYKNIKHNI